MLACLALACSDDPRAWTRVSYQFGEDATTTAIISIVQANLDANTCTRITLAQVTEVDEWLAASQARVAVKIEGLDHLVVRDALVAREAPPGYVDAGIAARCTNVEPPSDIGPPAPIVAGKLTFSRFRGKQPCSVSFELEVSQYSDYDPQTGQLEGLETFTAHAEDVDLYAPGCPHPNNGEASYTSLDAAFGEVDGFGSLVVSSYDADAGTCTWARALADASLAAPSEVEMPGTWIYSGVRVAQTSAAACKASVLVDPSVDPGPSRSAGPEYSRGTIEFGEQASVQTTRGPLEVPCTIDVDLVLATFGEYPWIPDVVRMRAGNLAVAGACE